MLWRTTFEPTRKREGSEKDRNHEKTKKIKTKITEARAAIETIVRAKDGVKGEVLGSTIRGAKRENASEGAAKIA